MLKKLEFYKFKFFKLYNLKIMDNKNLVAEKGKDDNWTCKVQINDKWKYIYSKYNPIRKINKLIIILII